tara:strand:+ start:399 stop:857 length:459 start_codon:yes stop_codon:yes gene_type:complete
MSFIVQKIWSNDILKKIKNIDEKGIKIHPNRKSIILESRYDNKTGCVIINSDLYGVLFCLNSCADLLDQFSAIKNILGKVNINETSLFFPVTHDTHEIQENIFLNFCLIENHDSSIPYENYRVTIWSNILKISDLKEFIDLCKKVVNVNVNL